MRYPRLRFRLHALLVLIAMAAVAMGGIVGLRRRGEMLQRKASFHSREAQSAADVAWGYRRFAGGNAEEAARFGRLHAYHLGLRRKYEQAANRPWLPVTTDPASPDNPSRRDRAG